MKVHVDKSRCNSCNFCQTAVACPGEESCTACMACIDACPQSARTLVKERSDSLTVTCHINGQQVEVRSQQTVLEVLASLGYTITTFPTKDPKAIFAPCRTGGCYSCVVLIDGELKPSCITPIANGMTIETEIEDQTPKRIVSGFQGHHIGGVGTPKELVSKSFLGYLEVACFASGCLYRCPTCQNWRTTYLSRAIPKTPLEASRKLTAKRQLYQVDRMAISGGESTLNRRWLVEFVEQLHKLNPDPRARIHVDTNAAILTTDYIDELIEAGMTDIGPDLKGVRLKTFMKITNVKSEEIASQYLQTSWNAVKYILDNYAEKIFMGVGIPYNKAFMSLDELFEIGTTLANWNPKIQVTVLDYRPEFRARALKRPTVQEMLKVKDVLTGTGLKKVICQTTIGHIQ